MLLSKKQYDGIRGNIFGIRWVDVLRQLMCAELERFVFNGIDTYRERDIVFLCCWLLFAWWLSNYHRHIATNERMNVWLNGCHPYCTTQLMALLTYIFFFSTLLHQITQISDSISGSQSSNNQNERSYYTSKEEK